jgi:hypothetical protein
MDFKYVPYLINGSQYYQLSAVDHQDLNIEMELWHSNHHYKKSSPNT